MYIVLVKDISGGTDKHLTASQFFDEQWQAEKEAETRAKDDKRTFLVVKAVSEVKQVPEVIVRTTDI